MQTGIVPQAIKTGPSKNTPEQNRPCEMCDLNDVESEYCFILCSTACDDLRESVFSAALQRNPEVFYWLDEEKLKWLNSVLILFLKLGKDGQTV